MKRTCVKCLIIVVGLLLLAGMIYLTVSHMIELNRPKEVQPVYHTLTYGVQGEGRIEGETQQTVEALHDGKPIEAVAAVGWYFKGWSDGENQLSLRQDCGVTHAVDARAVFEKRTVFEKEPIEETRWCHMYFIAQPGGRIEGELEQSVKYGENGSTVIAIADEGYRFVKWSDGETEAVRENLHVTYQSIIAIFAEFEKEPIEETRWCHMYFIAQQGGRIEGELEQSVKYGESGSTVIAIADEGYRFVKWSDGETEAVRENLHVTYQSGEMICAVFERYSRLFIYHYNEATSISSEKNVLISLDNLSSLRLSVPQREGYRFKGWYSDWHHTLQVSDEFGNLIVGKDWLQGEWWHDTQVNPENHLYAKWEATEKVPTYKILLIFVTEVHGDFETNSNENDVVRVDFVMSELQKRACLKIAHRLETYLEALLNATVDFGVDTYFTKEPLTRDNFYQGSTGLPDSTGSIKLFYDYGINVKHNGIPEVSAIIGNYRSVLTTFSLNDKDHELHVTAGSAGAKFGNIHFEGMEGSFDPSATTEETAYFDETYPGVFVGWSSRMELYIHEFAHTVEFQLSDEDCYGIHAAEKYYTQINGSIDTEFSVLGPYLRGEYKVEGSNVGIPYSFWEGTYQGAKLLSLPSAIPELKVDYAIDEHKKYLY